MMPHNISLIKYHGASPDFPTKVSAGYFGGYKPDIAKSFVCGFIDKLHATRVSTRIPYEQTRVDYSAKFGVYFMKLNEKKSDVRAGRLLKPINKKKLEIVTMNATEASFFVAINNSQLILIDDIAESKTDGLLVMKNSYTLDTELDESLVLHQIEERMKTGAFDHMKMLDEIMLELDGYETDDDE